MTLIQPNRQNFIINSLLTALIGASALGVIYLIFLYNQTVSLAHGAEAMRESTKQIETQNSELKGQIFRLFSPDAVSAFAAEHGLAQDRTPEYSPIVSKWVADSGR